MAVSEEVKKRFVEFIKLQVYDDKFIDRAEEKKILEVAIKNGITVDEGLAIMREVAAGQGYVVERDVEERATAMLEQFTSNDGKLDKKEFNDVCAMFGRECKNLIKDDDIKWRLKQIVLDKGWKVKEGGLFGSKWFSDIANPSAG